MVNIFVYDEDVETCAKQYSTQHLNKIRLEILQALQAASEIIKYKGQLQFEDRDIFAKKPDGYPPKSLYSNPWVIALTRSKPLFQWAAVLCYELNKIFFDGKEDEGEKFAEQKEKIIEVLQKVESENFIDADSPTLDKRFMYSEKFPIAPGTLKIKSTLLDVVQKDFNNLILTEWSKTETVKNIDIPLNTGIQPVRNSDKPQDQYLTGCKIAVMDGDQIDVCKSYQGYYAAMKYGQKNHEKAYKPEGRQDMPSWLTSKTQINLQDIANFDLVQLLISRISEEASKKSIVDRIISVNARRIRGTPHPGVELINNEDPGFFSAVQQKLSDILEIIGLTLVAAQIPKGGSSSYKEVPFVLSDSILIENEPLSGTELKIQIFKVLQKQAEARVLARDAMDTDNTELENIRYHATFHTKNDRRNTVHERQTNRVIFDNEHNNKEPTYRCPSEYPYGTVGSLEEMRETLQNFGFVVIDGSELELFSAEDEPSNDNENETREESRVLNFVNNFEEHFQEYDGSLKEFLLNLASINNMTYEEFKKILQSTYEKYTKINEVALKRQTNQEVLTKATLLQKAALESVEVSDSFSDDTLEHIKNYTTEYERLKIVRGRNHLQRTREKISEWVNNLSVYDKKRKNKELETLIDLASQNQSKIPMGSREILIMFLEALESNQDDGDEDDSDAQDDGDEDDSDAQDDGEEEDEDDSDAQDDGEEEHEDDSDAQDKVDSDPQVTVYPTEPASSSSLQDLEKEYIKNPSDENFEKYCVELHKQDS